MQEKIKVLCVDNKGTIKKRLEPFEKAGFEFYYQSFYGIPGIKTIISLLKEEMADINLLVIDLDFINLNSRQVESIIRKNVGREIEVIQYGKFSKEGLGGLRSQGRV